ncbi:hypothetical protein VRU48_00105 [Pedobacter sp. KR3-3]|uniref:Uncharacterized protein n=1 Tax=Pedobacter albus TaxID=3113905 RepID=A0ABU7I206_9SPHI|nr:hypothetical protein [Pedobacter sp. KR3-3]MEE1943486.1 hypothetical protein [Pedobacter sp. KR3-3]
MRKVFAILSTLITLYTLKETYYIFTTTDAEIVKQRDQLILVSLSVVIPLIVLSLWLWRPKPKQEAN